MRNMIAANFTCGGEISVESKGSIQSPSQGPYYGYPSNIECIWILTAPDIFTLVLGFTTFQVKNEMFKVIKF